MIARLQKLPVGVRTLVFSGFILLGIALAIAITLGVMAWIARNTPRLTPVALVPSVQVEEYALLPDDDAYPASVTVGQGGTIYSGSYVTGAIWAVDTSRNAREIPNTRERIGAVSALTTAPDGSIYVLDRITPLEVSGARVWRIAPDNTLTLLLDYTGEQANTLQLPHDIAVDRDGRIYITDRGRTRDHDIVWRVDTDGTGSTWWVPQPVEGARGYEPTGLAYDPNAHVLYISDGFLDILYRVPINDDGSADETTVLFDRRFGNEPTAPGFNGLTVTEEGVVYVAGLGNNKVGKYDPNAGIMTYLAGNYRGAADVAYDFLTQRLFVANWDQRSLLPEVIFLIAVELDPHLPFSIDSVIFVGE